MKFVPHEYQQRCIDFIAEHPAAGLFLDMGLGKTAITLTAVQELIYDRAEVSKVLVIAPLRVAEDTWSRESAKWDHLHGLRISKILGNPQQRRKAIYADADIYVTNRENVVWLVEEVGLDWKWDMIVVDELSSFKSPTAKRFKALRKVRRYADRIVGLTGTPAANGLLDLWAEIGLLDNGQRLGRHITYYRDEYFTAAWTNPQGVVYKYNPKPGAMEAITAKISDITVSMKASDYLQLPDEVVTDIEVTMPPAALKQYTLMEQEALLPIEGDEITAFSAAAVMTKLSQIADGFVYNEDHKAHRIHDAKVEALQEIIEQADGPVLVFYRFEEDAQDLARTIKGAKRMRGADDVAAWNRGEIPVMLTHPLSAGYGLNLQEGGHIIVWYGLTWSLEQYLQANARLHRQGQEKPVLIYRILAAGTVDGQVVKALEGKDKTQNAVLEILKERRKIYETME